MGYCAIAVQVYVQRQTGEVVIDRVVTAVDVGQVVSPDGLRNQVEGGIVQSASWTLYDQVDYDPAGVRSYDWSGYPRPCPGRSRCTCSTSPARRFLAPLRLCRVLWPPRWVMPCQMPRANGCCPCHWRAAAGTARCKGIEVIKTPRSKSWGVFFQGRFCRGQVAGATADRRQPSSGACAARRCVERKSLLRPAQSCSHVYAESAAYTSGATRAAILRAVLKAAVLSPCSSKHAACG